MSGTKTFLVMLIILLTVAGCSSARRAERAELAERAKTELVGLSKIELLTCAGVPVRSMTEDKLEFISYGSSGYSRRGSCVVTFVLRDAVVESVAYTGRTSRRGKNDEQCAYTVANCLVEE